MKTWIDEGPIGRSMSEKYRTGISLPLDVWRIGRKDAVDDGLDFSAYVCQLIEREHARRQQPRTPTDRREGYVVETEA